MHVVLEVLARAELRALAPVPKRRVKAALAELGESALPEPGSKRIRRLDVASAAEPVYRVRIGDYRAVFVVRPPTVKVLRIFHREEGYRWIGRLGLD